MEIKQLPKSLRNDISAEHNISSALECIRQLVINSLDAKATSVAIRVNLVTNEIQVVDNGIGISKSNLLILGKRYVTSKYHSINDIEKNRNTFPSRGIALADIINVSESVKIVTRINNNPKTCCKTFVKDTNVSSSFNIVKRRPSVGTTIIVKNLLYKRPVRKKSVNIDALLDEIEKEIKYIALIHPSISFSLRNDLTGSIIFHTSRTKFISQTMFLIFGDIFPSRFKKVYNKQGNISINGLINFSTFSQNILQLVYLNRRLIKNSRIHSEIRFILSKSKIVSIDKLESKNNYLLYIINIDCPYSEFDVIEYNDVKVEFKDWDTVIQCIKTSIQKFLEENNLNISTNDKNYLLIGSPISSRDPSIHMSQIDGFVRGIPIKRKIDFKNKNEDNSSIPVNKIQKLNYNISGVVNKENLTDSENNKDMTSLDGKEIITDMFLKSIAVYGKDKVQHEDNFIQSVTTSLEELDRSIQNSLIDNNQSIREAKSDKDIQTNLVAFSSKAIQTNTPENSDDFLFKKPLPPKQKLVKSKPEDFRFQINKIASHSFKSDENENLQNVYVPINTAKQRLNETCEKLKNRIYQDHFVNKKYQNDFKRVRNKTKLCMKQSSNFVKPAAAPAPRNVEPEVQRNNNLYLQRCRNRHQLSLFYPPIFNRSLYQQTYFRNRKINFLNMKPSEYKFPIYDIKNSTYPKWNYELLDVPKNSKYIFTNNDDIVSNESILSKVLGKKFTYQDTNFTDLQLSQLLPNISSKNQQNNLINYKNIQTTVFDNKRFLSKPTLLPHNQTFNNKNYKMKSKTYSEFSFIPQIINQNTNSNCKSQKTFNSHLNNNQNINKTNRNFNKQIFNILPNNKKINPVIQNIHDNLKINLNNSKLDLVSKENETTGISKPNYNKNIHTSQHNKSLNFPPKLHKISPQFSFEFRQSNENSYISNNISQPLETTKFSLETEAKNVENTIVNDCQNKNDTSIPITILNSTQSSFQIPDKSLDNLNDTPITILEQNLMKGINNAVNENYYLCDNYKKLYCWLENTKKYSYNLNVSTSSQNTSLNKSSLQKLGDTNFSFSNSNTPLITINSKESKNSFVSQSENIRLNTDKTFSEKNNNSIEQIEINVNPLDYFNSNTQNTPQKDMSVEFNHNKPDLKITDPIYDSFSTVTSNTCNNNKSDIIIINKINNNINLTTNLKEDNDLIPIDNKTNKCVEQRSEWWKQTAEDGSLYYLNNRTGMTSHHTPKSLEKYSMTTRQSYLPKGMSPILNVSNVQLTELTPNSKNILYETMASTENDELQTVKWMNYLQNKDSSNLMSNLLYSYKNQYETKISNLNDYSLSKKLLKSFDSYTFTKDNLNNFDVINQCDNKFIVAIIKMNVDLNLLVLFDQHAVHERICLEKFIKDYELEDDVLKSVKCKYPILLAINNYEIKMLCKYKKNFENWGLFYEISDQNIVINQIPLCWKSKDDSHIKQNSEIECLIMRLIQEESTWLKEIHKIHSALPLTILNTIKTEACRSAIKFGDQLTKQQCSNIIRELSKCDLPFQCAHGRPSLVPILELKNTDFEEEQVHLNNLRRI